MKTIHNKEKFRKALKTRLSLFLAILLMLSVVCPVLAVTQEELDRAEELTEEAKKEAEKAEAKRKAALAEFNSIDNQIIETEKDIEIVEKQIEQTKEDIELKKVELAKAEEDYEKYRALFLKRAMVMYENSDLDYLEILFGANDFSDFLAKLEMISQLMEYDRNILRLLSETKKEIEDSKKALEENLIRQEENAVILEERRVSLDETLAKKQQLLEEAKRDVEKYKAIYEAAEEAEAELIRKHAREMSYGANPTEYTGGKFAWPVPGVTRITSPYGYRIHPVYKTRKMHTGIDIGAGYGLDIVASADGLVTLATTNGGYGKCIIINHGSGLTTLYGHCSVLLVEQGTYVKRGQVIAKVGSTGVSTGPHLHYEVRKNGATVDPLSYVK